MKYLYAPGCALMTYKPQLAERLKEVVVKRYGEMDDLLMCCYEKPVLDGDCCVITPCTTCADRYGKMANSIYFLSVLTDMDDFAFPDYGGAEMSIQDTCSARMYPEYLAAIRKLLARMNIRLKEPEHTGRNARCCGQTFYGRIMTDMVEEKMRERAGEMPCEDVVVYCASCIMSMMVGGKRPRFILDLLFGEPTDLKTLGAEDWNDRLLKFRKLHGNCRDWYKKVLE